MSDDEKVRRLEQRVTNLEIALCAFHSLSESHLAPDQERAVSAMMGEFYERSKSLGGFQCAGFEGAGFEDDDLLSALEALLDAYEGVYDMATPRPHQSREARRAEAQARAAIARARGES